MIEKDMQSLFKVHLGKNVPTETMVYELKMEKGSSIAFARVYDHQVTWLYQAKHSHVYHKIADTTMSFGGKQTFNKPKPFDCMVIVKVPAWVIIMFYKPREKKEALYIDIDDWIKERDTSSRKSLTEQRAREISSHIVII